LLYGLPPPPKLLLETAEALNRAYADEAPLEGLLKKHRLLALARAPLPARLDVMRKIAALDRGNAAWAQDITELARQDFRDRPSRAFTWLAKQERAQAAETEYQNALLRLEQALAEGKRREELEQLHYAALQFERGVPAALEQRYQERLQTLVRAVRWREWLVV